MTGRRDAKRAFEAHGAFDTDDETFGVTTTPFDAAVTLEDRGEALRYIVTVEAPTLDAAVSGDRVGEALGEGWFETFERRVTEPSGATRSDPEPVTVELDDREDVVRVRLAFETEDVERGAEDAKALVDFVEGTYLQGVVPGYDYHEPVAGLLERAEERSDAEGRPPL